MQKESRLRKTREFGLVYRLGRSWADSLLVLRAMPNGMEGRTRFGFSVGKRTGNAVVRSTIKRRIREAVRHTHIMEGWDIVFIARNRAREADYHQLEASVRTLLGRANLLVDPSQIEKSNV